MKVISLTIIAVLSCYSVIGQKLNKIDNPLNDFIKNIKLDTSQHQVIHRINNDFNGDGLMDVALSYSASWGNKGGEFLFYLKTKDHSYVYFASLDLHPLNYGIGKDKNRDTFLKLCSDFSGGYASFCNLRMAKNHFETANCKDVKAQSGEELAILMANELKGTKKGVWKSAQLSDLKHNRQFWLKQN